MSIIRKVFLCSWKREWPFEEMEKELLSGKMKGGNTQAQYKYQVHPNDIFLMYHPSPQIVKYILKVKENPRDDVSYKSGANWTVELEHGLELRNPITLDDLRVIDYRPKGSLRRIKADGWNYLRKKHPEISGSEWDIQE